MKKQLNKNLIERFSRQIILKSATAAEKTATSTGKLFCVDLNISSAVST